MCEVSLRDAFPGPTPEIRPQRSVLDVHLRWSFRCRCGGMTTAGVPFFAIAWTLGVNVVLYFLNENCLIRRWVKHRGTLLVTNRSANSQPNARPAQFYAWDLIDPNHLSNGHRASPRVILLYREFIVAFFFFAIVYQGIWGSGFDMPHGSWFTWFTNWTFLGMAIYGVMGIVVAGKAHFRKGKKLLPYGGHGWELPEKAFLLLFVAVSSSAIFLTAFYWAVVYDGGKIEVDNVFRHGVNVVLMLGDAVLSRVPIVSYHLQVPFLYTTIYAIFMWIYFGASGDWRYEALDWNSNGSAVYYLIVPILLTISFYIVYLVAHLRERTAPKPAEEDEQELELAGIA